MDGIAKREELEAKVIEAQLKSKRDGAYLRILLVMGIITIILATGMTILGDLRMTPQSATLYVMGVFLFVAGVLWQENDKRTIAAIERDIEQLQDEEDDSYRYDSAR